MEAVVKRASLINSKEAKATEAAAESATPEPVEEDDASEKAEDGHPGQGHPEDGPLCGQGQKGEQSDVEPGPGDG